MNREILFRGKVIESYLHRSDGKWVFGSLVLNGNEARIFEQNNNTWLVDPETVGQFTDLRDKNGKWIFEKDIVKADFEIYQILAKAPARKHEYKGVICEVIYKNGSFLIGNPYGPTAFEVKELSSVFRDNIEVIGNTPDNYELLKGGKNA